MFVKVGPVELFSIFFPVAVKNLTSASLLAVCVRGRVTSCRISCMLTRVKVTQPKFSKTLKNVFTFTACLLVD